MKIEYWSDYACPFCYIGETSLKQAICNLGLENAIRLKMKAFELDPDGPKEYECPVAERNARKYGYPVEEVEKNIRDINIRGASIGLDMHYDKSRYTNTFDAHRITKLAQSKGDAGLTERLQERLFKAYFTDSLELADHKTLIKLATEAGLPAQEVQEVLMTDRYSDAVRNDEMSAGTSGVQGVPFFVINDKYAIPGALPVEKMEEVIRKVMDESSL
ncbi:MAG: DsbA family oxidoreductase [Mogibacterium sp.]|nr:DsbA family oxidoreductase [Mogibacterium sp.]